MNKFLLHPLKRGLDLTHHADNKTSYGSSFYLKRLDINKANKTRRDIKSVNITGYQLVSPTIDLNNVLRKSLHNRHFNKWTKFATVSLLLGFSSQVVYGADITPLNVHNAHNDEPSTVLDTIVVTATRSDRSLSDAPVPVQVLDKQILEKHHAHTLKQALALLPNVTLRELHGKTGYEVQMQGFSGDQVLILIDGLPITASTGSTVNLNQYLNVDIEQIEVIQGAASAQYGSSAMGGVINIITKPITRRQAHVTAEVASNSTQNPSGKSLDANKRFVEASLEGALDEAGHLRARLSGSYLDDAGLSVDPDAWPRLKDSSEQSQVSAKLIYSDKASASSDTNRNTTSTASNQWLDNKQIWLEASHYQEDDISRFFRYVAPRLLPQQRTENIRKQRYSIGASTDILPSNDPAQRYKLSASALFEDYQSQSDTTTNGLLASARDTTIQTKLAQAQLDLPMWSTTDYQSHWLQVGAQWQQDTLSQIKNNVSELRDDDVSRDVSELYLQDDWMIGDAWEILTGVRYQIDTDFGDHIAPKISVKYRQLDDQGHEHIFRGSVGSAYRVPNLKERYFVFDHSNLGYKVIGNPNLKPETSTSYQLGYSGQLTDNLTLNANAFYNDIEGLIQEDQATFEGNIAVYEYKNIDSAKTYGGDITVDWRLNPDATLKAGYTYTKTKNNTRGGELTNRPEHRAQLAFDYQLTPKLQLIEQLNYESRQLISTASQSYSPSWWTLDSKLNYQLNPNLDIYAAINNVFDVQRDTRDPMDYRPIDNREWLLGASYHW